ncbi:MAG TPA: hypothetical protein VKQ09_05845 [Sphingomonas sp.]|nr:hypothetical protein [Sphingomonas sp.]
MSEREPFRSWVEDYVRPDDDQPINMEAFRVRAVQRGYARRLISGNVGGPPTTRGQSMRQLSERALGAGVRMEMERRERVAADPAEQARLYLQRRGLVVFRAHVVDGPPDRWDVAGHDRWLTDSELIAHAERLGFSRPTTTKGTANV